MQKVEYSDNNGNVFLADVMLPCPFCGCEPKITFIGNKATKSRKVTIKCTGSHCRVERTDATLRHDAEWCAKTCIESWNTRVGGHGA